MHFVLVTISSNRFFFEADTCSVLQILFLRCINVVSVIIVPNTIIHWVLIYQGIETGFSQASCVNKQYRSPDKLSNEFMVDGRDPTVELREQNEFGLGIIELYKNSIVL